MRYRQIKRALREAEIIDEVSMSPSALERFANSPEAEGMLLGVEFEMVVPNASAGDDDYDLEPDYSVDQSAYSISDIVEFFRNGEFSNLSRSDAEELSSRMWDQFLEWQQEKISDNLDEDELLSRVRDRLSEDLDVDDYVDEARDELGDDASDSAVEDRAQELLDSALDEMMSNGTSDYEYDNIRAEMEEEMRDDADYDEDAWLNDIGVGSMQEAENEFSLMWPHMYNPNEGGGADVDQIAEAFTEGTGYRAVGYSGYHSGSRSDQQRQGYFIIEPDSSINADQGDAGLEFISPAMPLKDGLEMIKRVTAWAKDYGCYTNKSTGLHMNISVPGMTTENLDYVKLALFLGDEYVLKEFNRQYNTYAGSAMKIVREKIKQNPENATALLAKMKEHLNTAASKLVHSGITQKYTSINTKDNYVEFRGPGGDYLDQDITKLVSTALRSAQSLRIATNESAYKQEYAKKLYKLIGPKEGEWTDPNNSVALFSRYAMGEINKSELVSSVQQAQTARRAKKGDKDLQYWVMNRDESGGKQMVYAADETEAIIKGGKQMGLDREQSIRQLKAELVYNQSIPMPRTVPENWQYWAKETLPNIAGDRLSAVRQKLVDGDYELEPLVKIWLLRQVDNEMRSRMDNMADTAGRAENTVRASLPQAHREFLDDIANKSDMGLINILRNNNAYTGVSEQGAAYFRVQLRHELRRRGINPDSESEPNQANVSQDAVPDTTAAQTAQPAAATDGPGVWMVGNHTYGRETFRAGSKDAAIQAYADRNDISVADLTADRSFVAQLTDPDQGELDLREMRRLAGLK